VFALELLTRDAFLLQLTRILSQERTNRQRNGTERESDDY
jgi:hypothetical protein